MDLLAGWLHAAPTQEDVENLARKHPEKWVSAVTQIARTAGFTDKTEIEHNLNVTVGTMSDSQLEDKVRAMAQELNMPVMIEGELASEASTSDWDEGE